MVQYSGNPGQDLPASVPAYARGWSYYRTGIMVASEPSGALSYYPVNGHPSDKATYSFAITDPRSLREPTHA